MRNSLKESMEMNVVMVLPRRCVEISLLNNLDDEPVIKMGKA